MIPDTELPLAVAWATEDYPLGTVEADLYDRAMEIRDEQESGTPLWLIDGWEPWKRDYTAWMAAHPDQVAPDAQPRLL